MAAARKTKKSMQSKIHDTAETVHQNVDHAEAAVVGVVERVETAMNSVKAGFETAKAFGSEAFSVVDNAGRTTIGGAVTMHYSLVNYGKDMLNDTIDTGRKTFEAKSMQDLVEIQTSFAERRMHAMFHTLGALNTLAQNNTIAVWSPLAIMLRQTAAEGTKSFNTAA